VTASATRNAGADQPRLLLALDASRGGEGAMNAAVRLAARLGAEVEGLFVEDDNLMRAAGLPCSRLIRITSARFEEFTPETMARDLRLQARAARRALAEAAERGNVRWSFRVTRGAVGEQILAAAPASELVVLGRTMDGGRLRPRLGSTARRLAAEAPAVLFAGGGRAAGPVLADFTGSEPSRRALTLAAKLARPENGLVVLLSGDEASKSEAARLLEGVDMEVRYRSLKGMGLTTLELAVHETAGEMLVLSADNPALSEASIEKTIKALDLPVLLVRR